jgi:predicted double-glycine peptidase
MSTQHTTYTPLVRQAYEYSCGAAALASCLYYWGVFTGRETELYQQLGTTTEGTCALGIMKTASSYGLEVRYRTRLTVDDLRVYLEQGHTCILNIQAWGEYDEHTNFGEVWEDGHYVVLANVTDSDIIIMDPSIPGQYGIMSIEQFNARWHDWSDDGDYCEYHTAILLRGEDIAELEKPFRID